ncbi:hypothetical protein MAR_036654, partial [Mya arenaria]
VKQLPARISKEKTNRDKIHGDQWLMVKEMPDKLLKVRSPIESVRGNQEVVPVPTSSRNRNQLETKGRKR